MTRPISSAEAVFLALADLNSDEREAFLREHCGHDPQLRAEVDAMLQAIEATDKEFLDPIRVPSLDIAADDGPLQPGTLLAIVWCCTRSALAAWAWCMRRSKSTRDARLQSRCCAAVFVVPRS